MDVKAMLGEGGDVGYGGCEPRVEGNCTRYKKVLYNFKKIKKMWGGGGGGAIFEPKTLSLYLKKKKKKKNLKKKKIDRAGI